VQDPNQVLFVSGSVYATAPGMMRIYVEIDGSDRAEIVVYANQPHVHIPAVPQMFPMTLWRGFHFLRLKPAPNTPTASDGMDFYHVSMIEFPQAPGDRVTRHGIRTPFSG
jgi:hypothetical protein